MTASLADWLDLYVFLLRLYEIRIEVAFQLVPRKQMLATTNATRDRVGRVSEFSSSSSSSPRPRPRPASPQLWSFTCSNRMIASSESGDIGILLGSAELSTYRQNKPLSFTLGSMAVIDEQCRLPTFRPINSFRASQWH
jgi:hypothetical protein